VGLLAPGHPFEHGDDHPADQHDPGDLERPQIREREGNGQCEEEEHLEDEPRAATFCHASFFD